MNQISHLKIDAWHAARSTSFSRRMCSLVTASISAAVVLISPPALAQFAQCMPEPYSLVMPLGLSSGDQYGSSCAAAGDWLFVGAPQDDTVQQNAGAVYVFEHKGGGYHYRQKLLATGGVGAAQFGFSLAADGDVLIVGAQNDQEIAQTVPSAAGAAYIFRLTLPPGFSREDGGLWVQEQKLLQFGAPVREHGFSVAVKNNLVVVGARNSPSGGKGAAYIYRYNGTTWNDEQRIISDASASNDRFGTSVLITQNRVLVGCLAHPQNGSIVMIYTHNGTAWTGPVKLIADGGAFGTSMAAEGDMLIVGAPYYAGGIAYMYMWNHQTQMFTIFGSIPPPSGGTFSDEFGAAVAIHNGFIAVGAPLRTVSSAAQAGLVAIYRPAGQIWIGRRATLSIPRNIDGYGPYYCWSSGPQPAGAALSIADAKFGRAIAISSGGIFIGSALARDHCWSYTGNTDGGAINMFKHVHNHGDCNANNISDECDEPDCNANNRPDVCDISSQTSGDCNMNSVPDECEITTRYQMETGFSTSGWFPNPASGNADFIWLNQFRVMPGGQVITHVVLQTSSRLPWGTPVEVMVYSDPTNDGDPSDAVLLATAETTALSFPPMFFKFPRYVRVPISPTYVGAPGDYFFVGAILRRPHLHTQHPWCGALATQGESSLRRSWYAAAPPMQGDINNLSKNAQPVQLWSQRPFAVRAIAADCNANGAWDACDILNNVLVDDNSNGIPDSCEGSPCVFADVYPHPRDGVVNVNDLLAVINGWGGCVPCFAICPGDTNEDCLVNVNDLLNVINAWGACP